MVLLMEQLSLLSRNIETALKQYQSDASSHAIDLMRSHLPFNEEDAVYSDLAVDLEIVFRQHMEKLLAEAQPGSLINSDAAKFIHFSVDFAEAIFPKCPAFARLPFQLIDDFLEDKNISQAKEIWPLLEGLAEKLTTETLFPKGKFIMLKTCNFLLKKLSKSCDTEFCGRVLLFLAAIYPISEKSAANIAGRINTGNVTLFDSKDVFNANMKSESSVESSAQEDGEASDELHITYQLYEGFWKLQTYFASEFKALDQGNPSWTDFVANAKAVVDLLKSSSLAENDAGASASSHGDKDGGSNVYQGTKYLTSSQLFALQLRDPQLRQQVAIQLLIFTHYLKVKSLPTIASVEQRVNFLRDIVTLHNDAKGIIEAIPGKMSTELVAVVHRILEREENWIRWKSTGSNPFEKTEKICIAGLKRKADEALAAVAEAEAKKEMRRALPSRPYTFDCSDANIKQVASQWEHSDTHFAEKIQEYIDADDPECGIDEEYHPKHNHLYCWRTRRMLSERDLSTFDVMLDGDLGKGLRKFKNLPEPVPKPEQPEEEEEPEAGEEVIGRPPAAAKVSSPSESMDVEDGEEGEEQDGNSTEEKSSKEELEDGEEGEEGEEGEADGSDQGEAVESGEEVVEVPTASVTDETDDVLAGISYDAEEQVETMAVSEDAVNADNINEASANGETPDVVETDPAQVVEEAATSNVDEKIDVEDGTMEE